MFFEESFEVRIGYSEKWSRQKMTVESQRIKTRVESREKLVDMIKSDFDVSNVGFSYVDVGSWCRLIWWYRLAQTIWKIRWITCTQIITIAGHEVSSYFIADTFTHQYIDRCFVLETILGILPSIHRLVMYAGHKDASEMVRVTIDGDDRMRWEEGKRSKARMGETGWERGWNIGERD